jgi:hypothetical protein
MPILSMRRTILALTGRAVLWRLPPSRRAAMTLRTNGFVASCRRILEPGSTRSPGLAAILLPGNLDLRRKQPDHRDGRDERKRGGRPEVGYGNRREIKQYRRYLLAPQLACAGAALCDRI